MLPLHAHNHVYYYYHYYYYYYKKRRSRKTFSLEATNRNKMLLSISYKSSYYEVVKCWLVGCFLSVLRCFFRCVSVLPYHMLCFELIYDYIFMMDRKCNTFTSKFMYSYYLFVYFLKQKKESLPVVSTMLDRFCSLHSDSHNFQFKLTA